MINAEGTFPRTGTVDDDDDQGDEHADENEAPVGETDDAMEAPEEFQTDDEDDIGFDSDDDTTVAAELDEAELDDAGVDDADLSDIDEDEADELP